MVKFISFSVLSVFIRVNLWLISFLVLSDYLWPMSLENWAPHLHRWTQIHNRPG